VAKTEFPARRSGRFIRTLLNKSYTMRVLMKKLVLSTRPIARFGLDRL